MGTFFLRHNVHSLQLFTFVHKFIDHNYLLPTAFAEYFALNKYVHKYDTRTRGDLYVISVNKGVGKRSVRYRPKMYTMTKSHACSHFWATLYIDLCDQFDPLTGG